MNGSGSAHIDVKVSNPYDLFKEWQDEAKSNSNSPWMCNIFNLATASKNGLVSNRNVVLKELFPDGFSFLTTKEGKKIKHIEENPNVAATFLFFYKKDDKNIARQIRLEGQIETLNDTYAKKYYTEGRLFEKVRSHVCHQGKETDWSTLQNRIDKKFEELTMNKDDSALPDSIVALKVKPESFDFYYAWNDKIADRVYFTKKENNWTYVHLEA